ncbi:MAG: endo-1,4-beta-xylanase [Acetatifactor sp.]|nr:endo-1,4-beta-xylanase [Acetatifactor sp.]
MMRRKAMSLLLALTCTATLLSGCGKTAVEVESSVSQEVSSVQESSKEETSKEETSSVEESSEESQAPAEIDLENIPILKDSVMNAMGCRAGCAVAGNELDNPMVWDIVTTYFNAVTLGNELKPDALVDYSNGRCPGTVDAELNGETIQVPKLSYSRAERMLNKILKWNEENPDDKIMVRGHVLVWHSQTPEWFFHVDYDKNKDYVDKDTMNKRLEWYIRTVLTHFTGEDSKYKDLFYGWDVVNEAVADGTGTYRTDKENPSEPLSRDTHGSNSSWWHVYQSNEYIINAFKYANKYAPASLELYYNDYNECTETKMNAIVELLQAVKDAEGEPGVGTRIDAMGMQGHYDMTNPGFNFLERAINKYAAVVGNVQITEFDIKARETYDGSDEKKPEEYEKMANRYRTLYWVLKARNEQPNINVTGITFWGTADHLSWLQSRSDVGGGASGKYPQCPLLFDENYMPKPAYFVFAEE